MKFNFCPVDSSGKPNLKRGDLRNALVAYAQAETRQGRIEVMSLRAAARDLGVSSGAVYRHFQDKDALLIEVAHLGFMQLREGFHAIRPEGAEAENAKQAISRAYAFGDCYTAFAAENPTLWRLMFGRIGVLCRDSDLLKPELRTYTILDAANENIVDLFKCGALTRSPSFQDVRFAWSAIHGAADLAQSGARLDGSEIMRVSQETTRRTLLALGCREELLPEETIS